MNIITEIEKVPAEQWEQLLHSSMTRSFFQSRECYDLYAANPEFMTPFCLAVEDCGRLKGVIVGFVQADGCMAKRYLSRRAIINSGPLLADDISAEALTLLLTECKKLLAGKAIYVECRNFEDYTAWREVFEQCGYKYVPHLNFHVDTTSENVIDEHLSKSRKKNIRLSFRDGIEVVEQPTIEDVRAFYDVLHHLYQTRVKTPLYPLSFFEHLYSQPYSYFSLVKFQGKIIGGRVCVGLSQHTLYDWFACGEDGVYKNIYPSSVATYEALLYGTHNGYLRFDFMGAGKPTEGYGVRDFKASFGGSLVEHGRFLLVLNPALYNIGKVGVKAMKGELTQEMGGGQFCASSIPANGYCRINMMAA